MAVFNQAAADKLKASTTASKTSAQNLAALKKEQAMQAQIQKTAEAQARMTNRMAQFGAFNR
jgi:hypothetical protein